jgi:hypothetical protein
LPDFVKLGICLSETLVAAKISPIECELLEALSFVQNPRGKEVLGSAVPGPPSLALMLVFSLASCKPIMMHINISK